MTGEDTTNKHEEDWFTINLKFSQEDKSNKSAKEVLAERIRRLREEKQIPRQKAADDLGISRGALEYYEKGKRTPDVNMIVQMSHYYMVSSDYLLGLSEYKNAVNQKLADDLQLSDEAIELLDNPFNFEMVDAILCSDKDLLTSLLRSILMFLKPEETFNAFFPSKMYSDMSDDTTKEFIEYLLDGFPKMLLEDIKSTVVEILMVMKDDYSIMSALDNIDIHYERPESIINDAEEQETVSNDEE